jgi:hypothetical protein
MDSVAHEDPEQGTARDPDGWSTKDHLAHLAEWMRALLGYHLDGRPSHEVLGLAPSQTADWDFDRINALLYEKNRLRSKEDVLEDLKEMYGQVVRRIEVTPFDEFLKPRFPDDPEETPVLNWVIANTADHFREHLENIERLK